MADAPSEGDLFLVGRREAIIQPTRFDRAIVDTENSDVNVVLRAAAAMGGEVARYAQAEINDLALSTASDDGGLQRLAYDLYKLRQQPASNAVVELTLTRTDVVLGFTVPAGSLFSTDNGQNFATLTDVPFPAGSAGPLRVNAVAETAGGSGNVSAETITRVTTPQEDTSLVVTNAEVSAGGNDGETNDEFRDRVRDFFATVQRGTRQAIEFGASSVPRVDQATADEVVDLQGIPNGRVQLNISDEQGQANAPLANEVTTSLDEFRCLGVPVLVVPAVPEYVDIVAEGLQFTAGANTTAVLDLAASRLRSLVNTLAPGVPLRYSDLLSVLANTPQLIVPDGALRSPLGDLVPTTGTVVRTTRDRIQLNPPT